MKAAPTQLEQRENTASTRRRVSHTTVNLSARPEECGDLCVRTEEESGSRKTGFKLPFRRWQPEAPGVPKPNGAEKRKDSGMGTNEEEHRRPRGRWSVSPLWQAKVLLGVLRQQGLAGKGLVKAFEKWAPRVTGCSRAEVNRVYREQTGREMSDYILVQQADKAVRYNQLPPEADAVRMTVSNFGSSRSNDGIQPKHAGSQPETIASRRCSKQRLIGEHDPNVLLSTKELASLTGFRPKTIRRWVSRKLLNYIRVGNRFRFRLAAVELFLAQREVRK